MAATESSIKFSGTKKNNNKMCYVTDSGGQMSRMALLGLNSRVSRAGFLLEALRENLFLTFSGS